MKLLDRITRRARYPARMADAPPPDAEPEMQEAPDLEPEQYPPYIVTPEQKRRWNLCAAIAERDFGGEDGDPATAWMATRSLYQSDMPTA